MGLFTKKKVLSVELNDYVIRALSSSGQSLETAKIYEFPLEQGIVEEGIILDEMRFFELLKEQAAEWGGKHQQVRFFVPDSSVMMKSFPVPTNLEPSKLKAYVEMEIGRSIHLPFSNPLVDVVDYDLKDEEATLFAAPSEEVNKIIGLLEDAKLDPQVADIRALSNERFLHKCNAIKEGKTYLIADWSIDALSICILSNGQVEFLRYQSIDTNFQNWDNRITDEGVEFFFTGEFEDYSANLIDQVVEIERMINFFRFSMHKGDKLIDEIIVMGDSPLLKEITSQLKENFQIPIVIIDDAFVQKSFPTYKAKHVRLLGLALKENN